MNQIRFNSYSKYQMLADELRDMLINGNLQQGDRFPSESELCKTYGLSHITVRESLGILVNEGLIYRIQGKGSFVAEKKYKDSTTIGLVIPHLHLEYTDFLVPIIRSIESEAKEHGAHLLLCVDNDDIDMEKQNLQSLISRRVDGIIIFYIGADINIDIINDVKKAGIPLVMLDRYIPNTQIDYVISDNFLGAYQIAEALIEQRFESLILFASTENSSSVKDRIKGYKKAVDDFNIKCGHVELIKTTTDIDDQRKNAYNQAKIMLKDMKSPTGIIAINSPILMGVWQAIQEIGLKQDNFTIGCFDEPPSEIDRESVSVKMLQPLESMGKKSVRAIISKIEGGIDSEQIVLAPQIHKYDNIKSLTGEELLL